jgi:hypothetical protein
MKVVKSLLAGAAAGALATVAMSAVMLAAKRLGFTGELPPERITRRAFEAAVDEPPSDASEDAAVAAAHIGFGALAGAVFALPMVWTGAERRSIPIVASAGILYATGIWLVSYQGWVPALGIMPPASRDRRGRVVTMLVAHWVYGAALGALARVLGR